ncbi:hypothetical protein GF407_04760 [candidate division KSB1 bacterium]|nr:hypothetical protein [candidate division KSB1 bacterium]
MKKLWLSCGIICVLVTLSYGQFMVKNSSDDLLMSVNSSGVVSIGTTPEDNGSLIVNGSTETSTLTITDGAVAGNVLVSDASGNASWGIHSLSDVLGHGEDAMEKNAKNFGKISVGTSTLNAKVRVDGYGSGTVPHFGSNVYNMAIYATDYDTPASEHQIVIEGIGTVMPVDNDKNHLAVQGVLLGGTNDDEWIASGTLGFHNTKTGNNLVGVMSNVRPLNGNVVTTNLVTSAFYGINDNHGENDYGLNITADKNYLSGSLTVNQNLNVHQKVGINIGDREPAAWLEIWGNIYVNAPYAGFIMKSPNGSCHQVRINDDNTWNVTTVSCP